MPVQPGGVAATGLPPAAPTAPVSAPVAPVPPAATKMGTGLQPSPGMRPQSMPLSGPGAGLPFSRPTALDNFPSGPAPSSTNAPKTAVNPAISAGSSRSSAPVAPVVPLISVKEQIQQIAEICARQGVAKLESLRSNPENRFRIPFIYDGGAGNEEFMAVLRSLVQPQLPQDQPPQVNIYGGPNIGMPSPPQKGERRSRFS